MKIFIVSAHIVTKKFVKIILSYVNYINRYINLTVWSESL